MSKIKNNKKNRSIANNFQSNLHLNDGAKYNYDYFRNQTNGLDRITNNKGSFNFIHNFFMKKLMKYQKKGRLLDFGCGTGYFLKIANDNYETYGIDVSDYSIQETSKRSPHTKTIVGGPERLDDFDDGYFDIITAIDVLEHLTKPQAVIKKFNDKLAVNGLMLINVPNKSSLGSLLIIMTLRFLKYCTMASGTHLIYLTYR
jgi:2-polyprenyl-3-methyl-5-hydroxy-6-metoxy-1,4-benzoquinol methylase